MFLEQGANRGSISTGYDIDNSMLLDGQNTRGEITQTGGDRKTHTISFWHKRAPRGTWNSDSNGGPDETSNDMWGTSSEGDTLRFNTSYLAFFQEGGTGSSLQTNRKFRDFSAWYHFVIAVDTTQGTASNRIKMYVNGVQETSFSAETYPDQNDEFKLMQNGQMFSIGAGHSSQTNYNAQGYYADFHIIDGAAKAASDFGEFDEDSGIWKPKKYTGAFNVGSGTNGAHYKFAGTAEGTGGSSTGLDSSGNSNNMNFQNQDGGLVDTPTNNFNVMSLLVTYGYPTQLYEGSTKITDNSSGFGGAASNFAMMEGKWYWEFKASSSAAFVGIQGTAAEVQTNNNAHEFPPTMGIYLGGPYNYAMDATSQRNDGSISLTYSSSDIYGVALDLDNNTIYYLQNNTQRGATFSLDGLATGDGYAHAQGGYMLRPWVATSGTVEINFGGYTSFSISSAAADANDYGNFEYAPPSGYYALCTKNIAEYG